ncbi:hypothetical protein shim_12920 [Shimia sp. SK013]|uniref:hypothetical protein n=1 Tax=Shimia sp. SK013 TaxID=1389006 RepID=UPI0006B60A47|nr:hypothetical protein [Shimia sp. SK013]KPA22999.1 hypothetical protein shim_12920 [Shimia sp. SK013]
MFHLRFSGQTPANIREELIPYWNLHHALMTWCRRNQYQHSDGLLRGIQQAIESNDLPKAKNLAKQLPLGGMGCFDDIWLSSAGSKEVDPSYDQTVFEALLFSWTRYFLDT